MTERRPAFVRLASVGDVGTARVLAALLESEGITTRVHGESTGPYPLTVGQMAVTELWVDESRLEDAREVMLEAEVADAVGRVDELDIPDWRFGAKLLALAVLAWFAWMVVRGLLRVF